MDIIRTWAELDAYLASEIPPDLNVLLQSRCDQLMEYGDLSELGDFIIIQPGDTIDWPLIIDGVPTFEWVQRHGSIFEMPFVLSDSGAGHVLIIPDEEGIDPRLLDLCRTHSGDGTEPI
jgi:hypothetical protein